MGGIGRKVVYKMWTTTITCREILLIQNTAIKMNLLKIREMDVRDNLSINTERPAMQWIRSSKVLSGKSHPTIMRKPIASGSKTMKLS